MSAPGSVPFEPLWRLAAAVSDLPPWDPARAVAPGDAFTVGVAATMFGVSARQVDRWRAAGRLSMLQADRAAVALGFHPAEVWGELWWDDTARLFDQLRAEVELLRSGVAA